MLYGQVHVKLFTVKTLRKTWPPKVCYAPLKGSSRVLLSATELPETLVQVLRKCEYSIFDSFNLKLRLKSVFLHFVRHTTLKVR